MRKWKLIIIMSVTAFWLVGILQSTSWSQVRGQLVFGPFEITGYYQFTVVGNTAYENPNNIGLLKKEGKPDINLMREKLDVRVLGKFGEELSVFFEPRLFLDHTKAVGHAFYHEYESLATHYEGSGNMLRIGGNDFKAELWQAYVDYRKDNLWLRVGKQQIAWGEAIAMRILDTVNPLDLSQFFFFDRNFEEFDEIRVPQWFIRADYGIRNRLIPDLTFEFILNPGFVTPTLLPQQGSPYNVVSGTVKIHDDVDQGEPTVGAKISGKLKDAQFSLNFVTKPDDDAIGKFQGLSFKPFTVHLEGEHPRIYIFGGSANYLWNWAGTMLRTETTVTTNSPFQWTTGASRIVDRTVWKAFLGIDRPIKIIPGEDSLGVTLQFLETLTFGDLQNVYNNGLRVRRNDQTLAIALAQPLFRQRLSLEVVLVHDFFGSDWWQAGAHWQVGNHLRFDLYYNHFSGADKGNGSWRAFNWGSGPFFRFTYGF